MANFNKVILAGNLTRDPELRYTPKGTAIARLGLALNRSYTTETGEKKEEVTFVDVDAFGRQAEVIAQYMRKGGPILIEGRLSLDQWEDKNTHQKQSKLGVVLESFSFLDSRGAEAAPARPQTAAAPRSGPPPRLPQRHPPCAAAGARTRGASAGRGRRAVLRARSEPDRSRLPDLSQHSLLPMPKTEVILVQNIVGLGAESDQVKVAAGYARNYLFPHGLAIPLNAANKKRLEVPAQTPRRARGARAQHDDRAGRLHRQADRASRSR